MAFLLFLLRTFFHLLTFHLGVVLPRYGGFVPMLPGGTYV